MRSYLSFSVMAGGLLLVGLNGCSRPAPAAVTAVVSFSVTRTTGQATRPRGLRMVNSNRRFASRTRDQAVPGRLRHTTGGFV